MERLGVFATLVQAIYGGFNAHAVAFQAVLNAITHLWCDVAHN
jgi:hypothetical protein